METNQLTVHPIGVITTPFSSKYGAPRQPGSSRIRATGIITLRADSNFEQALEDLTGFDYVWVLFWFHENSHWHPKVLPPDSGRKKRGVFATRSPHRPNPIGLSLCRLLGVEGRTLKVENPDMLDGTPVLDIKPYLPHAEAHPDARGGWIAEGHEKTEPKYTVSLAPEVRRVLAGMDDRERDEITGYLTGVLSRDPHPHVYRRIKTAGKGTYVIAVRFWRFVFSIKESTVHVFSAGGIRDALNTPEKGS